MSEIRVVTRVYGTLEAEILRGLLESRGIPVVLSHESAGTAIGLSVGPLGEVEILVPADQLEAAREILQQYSNDELDSTA